MVAVFSFPDWPAKRNTLRAQLARREPFMGHAGRLHLVPGEVVPYGSLKAPLFARNTLLMVASDVVPAMLVELAGAPLDELCAVWDELGGPVEADPSDHDQALDGIVHAFASRLFHNRGPTRAWVRRWHLPAHFNPAPGADDWELVRLMTEECWGIGTAVYTLAFWRAYPLVVDEAACAVDGYSLRCRLDPELGTRRRVMLPDVWWDPQHERRADAQRRILAEVSTTVRHQLARIAAESRRVADPGATVHIRFEHLVWLARYQFGGESYAEIGSSVGKTRQNVSDAVRAAAALIHLPLRAPLPAGRPRSASHPHIVTRSRRPR